MAKTDVHDNNDGRAVNLERAASVIVHTPHISAYLQRTDPKARKQLMDALMDSPVLDPFTVKPEDALAVLRESVVFLTSVITGLRHLTERAPDDADDQRGWYLEQLRSIQSLVDDVAGTPGEVIAERERAEACAWFAGCTNEATGKTPHPVLGPVATCDRCHTFATGEEGRVQR